MSVWYGIIFVVSIILLVVCAVLHKKENPWLLMLFASLCVTNFGYFALSVSPNLKIALLSNAMAYLGSVFLPIFMLIIISQLCRITIPKWLMTTFFVIGTVIFIIASSGGYSDVYYKTVSMKTINNTTVLVKTYGFLHPVYKVYVITFIIAMFVVIIYSFMKKEQKDSKVSAFLAVIVSINLGVWLIEGILGSQFEYLSVSYVATELLLLLLYEIIREYNNMAMQQNVVAMPAPVYFTKEDAECILSDWSNADILSNREKDVMLLLLEGKKRREIAEELFVTESTIKKHSASIYKKLEVENRKELLEKVKSERIKY